MRLKDSFREALGLLPVANAKGAIGAKAHADPHIAAIAAFALAESDTAAPANATNAPFAFAESAETGAEAQAERAAIMAVDGGLPEGWANALAAMLCGPRPANISYQRWSELHEPLLRFADQHAGQLHELNWTFEELFGVPKNWNQLDQRAVGWAIARGALVHATSQAITLVRNGARYTHRKALNANHDNATP